MRASIEKCTERESRRREEHDGKRPDQEKRRRWQGTKPREPLAWVEKFQSVLRFRATAVRDSCDERRRGHRWRVLWGGPSLPTEGTEPAIVRQPRGQLLPPVVSLR